MESSRQLVVDPTPGHLFECGKDEGAEFVVGVGRICSKVAVSSRVHVGTAALGCPAEQSSASFSRVLFDKQV